MKLHITKKCEGIIDTNRERKRIEAAFKDDPATRKQLTKVMDAIEALDWNLAAKLLSSKWWQGRDKRQECPRLEFVGMVHIKKMDGSEPAEGFDIWSTYDSLVLSMINSETSIKYEVKKVE